MSIFTSIYGSQAIQENEKRLAEVHQDNHWLG
jgi:hypothetical protein